MKKKKIYQTLAVLLVLCTVVAFSGCASESKNNGTAPAASVSAGTSTAAASSKAGPQLDTEASAGTEASAPASGDPIRIAVLAPFTGNFAQYGEGYQEMIEMVLEDYNAKGGVNGRPVTVDYFDDKMDAKEAVMASEKIASGPYCICLGPWSTTMGLAALPAIVGVHMPLNSISVSHVDFAKNSEYVIRQSPSTLEFVHAEARLCVKEWGYKTAAIFVYHDDMCELAAQGFQEAFEENGGTILANERYTAGDVDFSAQLTKIIQANPDYINMQGSYSDTARIVAQARDLGYKGRIGIPNSSYDPNIIPLLGKEGEGAVIISSCDVNHPKIKPLADAFSEKYGHEMTSHSYLAHETIIHVLKALEEVGDDREALKDYLRNDPDAPGTYSNYSVVNGETNMPLFAVTIKDGEFTTYYPSNCTLEDLLD